MIYKSWENGWLGLGVGFDKDELTQFIFNISFCIAHRYFDLNIALLGGILDFHIYEPLKDSDLYIRPGRVISVDGDPSDAIHPLKETQDGDKQVGPGSGA